MKDLSKSFAFATVSPEVYRSPSNDEVAHPEMNITRRTVLQILEACLDVRITIVAVEAILYLEVVIQD